MKYILTLTLFFTTVSATSLTLPQTTEIDFEIIPIALRKLEREYKSGEPLHQATPTAYFHRFYLCTVLMHIRFENYAKSFMEGRVPLNHILGLAQAFAPYKSHVQLVEHGFTECNEAFLTAVLDFQQMAQLARRSQQLNSDLENSLDNPINKLTLVNFELAHVLDNLQSPEDTLSELQSLLSSTQDAILKVQQHIEDKKSTPSAPLSESNINRTIKKK